MPMTPLDPKFSFPLFCESSSTVNLGKNEKLIISDIWAFWDYVVKKSSKNAKERSFMASLLEQAKHFYLSAENSPIKSQPLLYYYAFLNFSKILLVIKDNKFIGRDFYHGIGEKNNGKFIHSELNLFLNKQNVNVASVLMGYLEPKNTNLPKSVNVKNILRHCVGVHRAYCEIYSEKEAFVRIQAGKLYKHGKELIWKAGLATDSAQDIQKLSALGYTIEQDEETKVYHWVEKIVMDSYSPTRADYASLSALIREKGIWYFIGNSGHTLYVSKEANHRYSQESIIYLVMFYLGSITRYHPYLFEQIFSDKEQWLMSEFLSTQPKQFLYLATSRILGQSVLKAYASF